VEIKTGKSKIVWDGKLHDHPFLVGTLFIAHFVLYNA